MALMRSALLVVMFLLALQQITPSQAGVSYRQQREFVNAHNSVRARAPRACRRLPRVHWDGNLASIAQRNADTCDLRYRGGHDRRFSYLGENIYLQRGLYSPRKVVSQWAKGKADLNDDGATCHVGRSYTLCQSYTQLVWDISTAIGCGVASCGRGKVVVCMYGPGGNLVGRRPYSYC